MKLIKLSCASLIACISISFSNSSSAQLKDTGVHLLLGGGYLEQPENAYFFVQLGWTAYEDARFAHTIFGEGLFHGDDSRLDFLDANNMVLFSEDADIVFSNLTANYELELKIFEPVSLYVGGGAGAEAISINDRFDVAVDEDYNFVAQAFAGVRVKVGQAVEASVGVRRIFREDFSLLNDQFITEDTWGLEAAIGVRF